MNKDIAERLLLNADAFEAQEWPEYQVDYATPDDWREAAAEITSLRSALSEAEKRADRADEDAAKLAERWTEAVGLREEMQRRFSGLISRAEKAEAELAQARKALRQITEYLGNNAAPLQAIAESALLTDTNEGC